MGKPIPTLWDCRRELARWWAERQAIRYSGNSGGWLYRPFRRKAIAQGYGDLYRRYKREIWDEFEAWSAGRIR